MNLNLSYLDRGTWTSTVFSLSSRDFCKVMYDKNQLWYKYWTEHVSNDIEDKCLNVSGVGIHRCHLMKKATPIFHLADKNGI